MTPFGALSLDPKRTFQIAFLELQPNLAIMECGFIQMLTFGPRCQVIFYMSSPHTYNVEKPISAIACSPDGESIAVVGRDGL